MNNFRKKLKVLIYEPYPFNRVAGNLRMLSYLLQYLNRDLFEPLLVVPFENEQTNKWIDKGVKCVVSMPPATLLRYGGKIVSDGIVGRWRSFLDLVSYNMRLRKLMENEAIDVIYCNGIRSILCIGVAARLRGKEVFWYIKGELQNTFLDSIGFVLANRIAFQCKTNRDDKYPILRWLFKKKICIVKSGVDLSSISIAEAANKELLLDELSIRTDRTNIVVLGQVYPLKGIHYLLEAFMDVAAKFPDAVLYVVGDCVIEEYRDYQEDLIAYTQSCGMADRVKFTGWRPDALRILSIMDILVHPSTSEGMPRAVMEAMALGKTVIATKVGGTREIINDGVNGFLVNPRSSDQIAQKLSTVLASSELREMIGEQARKTIFEEYRIEDKIKQVEELWSKMCRNT